MSTYECWFCSKDCTDENHHFSWEFDTPICVECFDKLKNDPTFADNGEGKIMREEFKITNHGGTK